MKKFIFLSLFVLISFSAMAIVDGVTQLPSPVAPGEPDPPPPPPGLPIDGGILAGVCVALAYGAKKTLFSKDNE
ncbi:hypothetical protein [Pseudotamlana agarivorans]|uniref:hypothetical protein n=1 Tax=Pseudotamlana agarivorans TaxID=481183 RepID=UPI0020907C23|nr:hypothetical protein [Tamlana agarivorans]